MLRNPIRLPIFNTFVSLRRPAAARLMSLFNTTRLQGETVLITGASGGSSLYAFSGPDRHFIVILKHDPTDNDIFQLSGIGKATALLFAKVRLS